MIQGLYSAATAMRALEENQAVTANNIANISTPGFKRQSPINRGFYKTFFKTLRHPFFFDVKTVPGGGTVFDETFTDTTTGPITPTGDPLNIALVGPGYISVSGPNGNLFTRNGKFSIDIDGQLSTPDGYKVNGVDGFPIDAGDGVVEISETGVVFVNGEERGQLNITVFDDPHMLSRAGHNFYTASQQAMDASRQAEDPQVIPASLEMSNVQLPREMVNMITALRAYAANQRVIVAIDETMQRVISQVGTPF